MADTSMSASAQKLQKCIADSWKVISKEWKNYTASVKVGLDHLSLLNAHKTTLKNIMPAQIEDTELFKVDPDIKPKLHNCIIEKIHSEENCIIKVLNDLQSSYSNILVQIDRISNVYKSCSLDNTEIVKGSESSVSFAEMLEALGDFKKFFIDDHMGRETTLDLLSVSEDIEKLIDFWNVSKLASLLHDLECMLPTS